jgi:HD-GYP domain-containing protein (c-di-GMP phosphodiesterase class II)
MMVEISGGGNEEIERAMQGARLHDIGKIGIPDRILQKPEKLTENELTIIKEHPVIGAKILQPIESLKSILSIVHYHHERMDGSGYPEGLSGSRIPLLARITAVADVFDALTSNRPYRKAMKRAKAFQIIEDQKKTKLCPDSVELFFKAIEA